MAYPKSEAGLFSLLLIREILFKANGPPKLGGTTDKSVRPNRDERFIFLPAALAKDKKMKPKIKTTNVQKAGKGVPPEQEIYLQEQFIKQVKDDSRSANQVLTEQKDDRLPDDSAPLFVP